MNSANETVLSEGYEITFDFRFIHRFYRTLTTAMVPVNIIAVVVAVFVALESIDSANFTYIISSAEGLGRRFDGVGGLSGGGCSSRLIADYSTVWYNEIMDYLFLPGFGASLQILKVEIGGDV